jgi:hypothetical protein
MTDTFMNQPEVEKGSAEVNRREFIRGASFGSLMLMMGGVVHAAGRRK